MRIEKCRRHPKYRGLKPPRRNGYSGKICWYCSRIFRQRERLDAKIDRDLRALKVIDQDRPNNYVGPVFVPQILEGPPVDLMFHESFPGCPTDQLRALNAIRSYCRVTKKPYGGSFVCPWSHASGRRLPRTVALHRDHIDCVLQIQCIGDGAAGSIPGCEPGDVGSKPSPLTNQSLG